MEKLRILEEEEKYLGRNIRLRDIPQIEIPNYESYVLNDFYDNCKHDRLKNFISVVSNNMGHCNFYLLYNNLQTLKIEKYSKSKWKRMEPGCRGDYDPFTNTIRYVNEQNKDTFEHECFHVFSTFYSKLKTHCGFMFYNNDIVNFGIGLNESYTLFNTYRQFNIERLPNYAKLSWLIEKIIGKEEMELLYSNANLRELLLNLIQYSDESKAINLINKLDYLYFLLNNREEFFEDINSVNTKMYEIYKNIQTTLFVMLAKKGTDELYDCLENDEYVRKSPGMQFNMFSGYQISNYKVLSKCFYELKNNNIFY